MMFTDQIPTDVHQISAKVTLLSKVVWPALATLVPAGVTAAFKWAQDHSRKRRSSELTGRISELAKSISELPELPAASTKPAVTPRSALTAELESAVLELTALQARASHRVPGVSTITAKVRDALLLYIPKGLGAWTLHTAFFLYSFFLIFCLYAVMTDPGSTPFVSTKPTSEFITELLVYLLMFGVLGIPPMIMRHYASKIHRRQCAQSQAAIPSAAAGSAANAVPRSQEAI
jgi:hypothetical protein